MIEIKHIEEYENGKKIDERFTLEEVDGDNWSWGLSAKLTKEELLELKDKIEEILRGI